MKQAIETEATPAAAGDRLMRAFQTVEAQLQCENWFFQTIRGELEKTAPLSEYPTVMGANGHDYLLHLTQFLFFLRALDCTDPEAVAQFIDAHNRKVESQLSDPGFSKSKAEFRKAVIKPARKVKILDSVRALGQPVFAIYDIAHLLIDEMSPKTTEKLIEDLRFGRLLERRADDRMDADPKRVLIGSPGFLEDTYATSLLMQRRLISDSLSPGELERLG